MRGLGRGLDTANTSQTSPVGVGIHNEGGSQQTRSPQSLLLLAAGDNSLDWSVILLSHLTGPSQKNNVHDCKFN